MAPCCRHNLDRVTALAKDRKCLKDALNAMVHGRLPGFSEAYAASSPEGKVNLIRRIISDGRDRAKTQVMNEFPETGQFVAAVGEDQI